MEEDVPDYSDKMEDFLVICEQGKTSLLLYDDNPEEKPDGEWESLEATFGRLHWELPPDIARYVEHHSPEGRKLFAKPYVVILRQLQFLLMATMDCFRSGGPGSPIREFGVETLAELSRMLFEFHQEATRKQEKLAEQYAEDEQEGEE